MAILGDVKCLVQASNGDVLAGTNDSARIYVSSDNGQTWTQITALGSSTDSVNAFCIERYTGYLFAAVTGSSGAQGVWRSINNGSSWTRVKSHPLGAGYGYLDVTNPQSGSQIFAVGYGTTISDSPIVRSSNSGATWVNISTSAYDKTHMSAATYKDAVLATQYPVEPYGSVNTFIGVDSYYTAMYGAGSLTSVSGFSTVGGGAGNGGLDMVSFLIKDASNLFRRRALWAVKSAADVTDTEIWQWPSTPTGPYSFAKIFTYDNKLFNVMYVDPIFNWQDIGPERTIWAGANGEIYVSYNSGLAWSLATSAPTGQIYSFVRTTDNVLIAGGASGEIFIFGGSGGGSEGGGGGEEGGGGETEPTDPALVTARTLGRGATCENEVFVTNKFSFSQITHVFYYDGSTYDNLQFENEPPYDLFGSTTPTTGRILYLGSLDGDANVPGGPFSGVVFDIDDIGNDLTVTWEYYDGSTWSALTLKDGTDNFKLPGVNSVHWRIPSDWAATTVNSVSAFWVRARISAVGSSPAGPVQQNRYIYTPSLPYVEVGEDIISGDLPALSRIHWHNQAETEAGDLGTGVDRFVIGLKSVDRGSYFNAYLNISDEEVPFGSSLSLGTGAAWGDEVSAPTGRALTVSYGSAGDLNKWNDIVTFTLGSTIARSYYGTYRAFLRCSKVGVSQDWQVRVKSSFGSGGGVSYSQTVFLTPGSDWEIADLGQMAVPVIKVAQQAIPCNQIQIIVQGNCSATGSDVILYDLILIPVDEWAIDAKTPDVSSGNSAKIYGNQFIDIDSASNPKGFLTAMTRNSARHIISQYHTVHNGAAILQIGQQQRLWFVGMNYDDCWISLPEVAGTVQLFKKQRYLGYRGNS